MGVKKVEIIAVAVVLLLPFPSLGDARVFDVTKYGAKADGKTSIDRVIIQTARPTVLRVVILSVSGKTYLIFVLVAFPYNEGFDEHMEAGLCIEQPQQDSDSNGEICTGRSEHPRPLQGTYRNTAQGNIEGSC